VRRAAPGTEAHGRIADGGGPVRNLEARMRWSGADDSGRGIGLQTLAVEQRTGITLGRVQEIAETLLHRLPASGS
jgi:hypothetical protein